MYHPSIGEIWTTPAAVTCKAAACVLPLVANTTESPGCTSMSVATAVCVPVPKRTYAAAVAAIRTNLGFRPPAFVDSVAPADVPLVVMLTPVAKISMFSLQRFHIGKKDGLSTPLDSSGTV
jgi:hypothetical protein